MNNQLEIYKAQYPVTNRIALILAWICLPFVKVIRFFESPEHVELLEIVTSFDEKSNVLKPSLARFGWFASSGRLLHACDVPIVMERKSHHFPLRLESKWSIDANGTDIDQMSSKWGLMALAHFSVIEEEINKKFKGAEVRLIGIENTYPIVPMKQYAMKVSSSKKRNLTDCTGPR